jgi:hypothetical protein
MDSIYLKGDQVLLIFGSESELVAYQKDHIAPYINPPREERKFGPGNASVNAEENMKVKIFRDTNMFSGIEDGINDWLNDCGDVIQIVNQLQSIDSNGKLTISIWYKKI